MVRNGDRVICNMVDKCDRKECPCFIVHKYQHPICNARCMKFPDAKCIKVGVQNGK